MGHAENKKDWAGLVGLGQGRSRVAGPCQLLTDEWRRLFVQGLGKEKGLGERTAPLGKKTNGAA